MHLQLDEEQQEHLYGCLLAGNGEWKGVQKKLAKLNREDDSVERALVINAGLRKILNPKAGEEALEAERKRTDPSQLSIEDQPASSGETGGGHPPGEKVTLRLVGEEAVPPTNEILRDTLIEVDRFILLADIRGWTSSERDAVVLYAKAMIERADDAPEPEEPEHLATVALRRERLDELGKVGPFAVREVHPDGADPDSEPSSVQVIDKSVDDVVDSEYVDAVEAEVKCARLNREHLKHGDMDPELVSRWLQAGPWAVMGEPQPEQEGTDPGSADRWFVVLESAGVKERAADMTDADFTAARYNRSVAGRDDEGNWREPPVRLTEEAAQEIKSAVESTE